MDERIIFACYPRVSTDEQGATNLSIPTQTENCQRFLNSIPNATLWEDYILQERESGMIMERPQLTKIRDWMRTGKINALIINSSDRLSRQPKHAEELFDEMLANKVRLFIVMHGRELKLDNPSDRQLLLMEMSFNRQWWWTIRRVMGEAQNVAIQRGSVSQGGAFLYGYRRQRNEQTRMIDMVMEAPEAGIIQDMFTCFVYGDETGKRIGATALQRRLAGTPTPIESEGQVKPEKIGKFKRQGSGEWHLSTIYRILRNEAYAGIYTMHRNHPTLPPKVISIPVVIERDLWDKAQAILDVGKKRSHRNAGIADTEFLMARRLDCACGKSMHVQWVQKKTSTKRNRYYLCSTKKNRSNNQAGPYCGTPSFRADVVDGILWAWLADAIRQPKMFQTYLEEVKKTQDQRDAPVHARLLQIAKTREKQEQTLKRTLMLSMETDSQADDSEVFEMLKRIRNETSALLKELRQEETDLRAKLVERTLSQQYIDNWTAYAARVRENIDSFTFEEKREAIDFLGITGVLKVTDRRTLEIHVFDAYADEQALEELVTDSEAGGKARISHKLLLHCLPVPETLYLQWPALQPFAQRP